MNRNPLALPSIKSAALRAILRTVAGLKPLEAIYNRWLSRPTADCAEPSATEFIDFSLESLGCQAEVHGEAVMASYPSDGPLIIVANHPYGGLEGLLLTRLLLTVRPDLKVLTNEILLMIPELRDVFIGVDVLAEGAASKNSRGIRQTAKHLAQGGALLIFPAGTVSRLQLPSGQISDAPWSTMIARLARKYSAPVAPVFVAGRNPMPFYWSGVIHPRLRTLMLPRVMRSKKGRQIPLVFGDLIPASDLQKMDNEAVATAFMRLSCMMLEPSPLAAATSDLDASVPIRADRETDQIVAHLETLSDCVLHEQNNFVLYCAPYDALGPVMEQLAIERERTFRQVDEGTGRELDSDCFDPHYVHLLIWDSAAQKIAGGYRLGKTNEIARQLGIDALYTQSLFKYDKKFLDSLGGTIEVGRSFVTPDYQRNPRVLDLLWKGIGRFVVQNPGYHTLFGSVSISKQYSQLATLLLKETFLTHYGASGDIQKQVKARKPFEAAREPWTRTQLAMLSEIPIINKLVGRIDAGRSIPVLIRHYLSLNGRFVSFTVNEGFNDALDGLILVDLRATPERYLKRYMGPEGMALFQAKHGLLKNAA
ncbi:MAG: GNAT family N-acyltransferase [Pseudomonadota bacterium]